MILPGSKAMTGRTSLDLLAAAAAFTTLVLWASAFPGIRAGLRAYTPGHLALLRYLVASTVLLACSVPARVRVPARRDLPRLAFLGLAGIAAYNVALNFGEQTVPAGEASLLVNTVPIFTALFATVFLGERLKVLAWVGLALSLAGVILIVVGHGDITGRPRFHLGVLIVLLAAVLQAAYFVAQRPLIHSYSPLEITTYAIIAGTIGLLFFLPGFLEEIRTAPAQATLAVGYLGVFPAAIGYLAWSVVLSRMPSARAASFLYVIPVFAFVIGWAWLGEVPRPLAVIGGIVAVNFSTRRTVSAPPE